MERIYQKISSLEIPTEQQKLLIRALEFSGASFVATCTNLVQGRDSHDPETRQLLSLRDELLQHDSALAKRDAQRVVELKAKYNESESDLAVLCADQDTRHWLARQLERALEVSSHPDNKGVKVVSADPPEGHAGKIVIIAPDNPLRQQYSRQTHYPSAC